MFSRDKIGPPLFRDGFHAVSQVLLSDLTDITDFLHGSRETVLFAREVDTRARHRVRSSSTPSKLVLVSLQQPDLFDSQEDLFGSVHNDTGSELHLGAIFFNLVEPRVPSTGSSRTDDGPLGLLQQPGDTGLSISEIDLGAKVFDTLESLIMRWTGTDT